MHYSSSELIKSDSEKLLVTKIQNSSHYDYIYLIFKIHSTKCFAKEK